MAILKRWAPRLHPSRLYHARVARSYLNDVAATIDQDAFLSLRKAARDRTPILFYLKYFNYLEYLQEHLTRASYLGLNSRRGMDILDIGAGFGYFCYICEYFGHHPKAIDVPGVPLFDDVTSFFRIPKTHFKIHPYVPLPDLGAKFDLITAVQLGFMGLPEGKGGVWGPPEWEFFLDDVFRNHLKPGGRIYFEINFNHRLGDYLAPEVDRLFARYGGRRGRGNRLIMTSPIS